MRREERRRVTPDIRPEPEVRETPARVDVLILLRCVVRHWRAVLGAMLLGTVLAGLYGAVLRPPEFEATARLYIMGPDDAELSLADLQIGALLTLDYREALRTWEVQEMVREELNLELDYPELRDMLEVSNPDGSRVLNITVRDKDAQLAADVANAYARAAKAFFLETQRAAGTEVFSVAIVPGEAAGPGLQLYVLLGAALGFAAALAVLFARLAFDESPRTPEDIARAGLPTLAVVPRDKPRFVAERERDP